MRFQDLMWISLGAGLCTVLGALLMFAKRKWNDGNLAWFLGMAAGVMTAVVLFDMLPSAAAYPAYHGTIGGVALGVLIMAVNRRGLLKHFEREGGIVSLGHIIMIGIALHDLPEGMAIALGAEMKARTAMVIALGISLHNIPEGMAMAAPLLMGRIGRLRIMLKIAIIALVTPIGTYLGMITMAFSPAMLPGLLGMASGIMAYIVVFQLWPEARRRDLANAYKGLIMGTAIILVATFA